MPSTAAKLLAKTITVQPQYSRVEITTNAGKITGRGSVSQGLLEQAGKQIALERGLAFKILRAGNGFQAQFTKKTTAN